jgi:hypothetical protein
MQQKVIVILIFHSQHILAIHDHHQVSYRCAKLVCPNSQVSAARHRPLAAMLSGTGTMQNNALTLLCSL